MLSRVEALRNRRNNYNLEIVIAIKHLEMLKESHIVCRKDSDMTVTECNIQSSSKKNDTNDVTLVQLLIDNKADVNAKNTQLYVSSNWLRNEIDALCVVWVIVRI